MGEDSNAEESSGPKVLGLWKRQVPIYGGLLLVKCDSDSLEGWELLPPSMIDPSQPLRRRPLFRLESFDAESQEFQVLCLGRPNESEDEHEATVKLENGNLVFKCSSPEIHHNEDRKFKDLEVYIQEEKGCKNEEDFLEIPYHERTVNARFFRLRKHNLQYSFQRLYTSVWDRDLGFGTKPIACGLFAGAYSFHGNEIIELTYELDSENEPQAIGTKITGDNNVHAGEVTFKAYLNNPITFTSLAKQTNLSTIMKMKPVKAIYADRADDVQDQPFGIPEQFMSQCGPVKPSICTHRFHAKAQVAEEGFQNPKFIKSHWVVFNEDLFGVVFLELQHLILYHRVKDLDLGS